MKASVVVSCYNYSNYIDLAIGSVINQKIDGLQIILVDDGSSDNSLDHLKKYSFDDLVLLKKENAGQLSCFNAALPHIQGEYVFFLDADDSYELGYIAKALQFYDQNRFCDFLFCNHYYIDKDGNKLNVNKNDRIFPEKNYYGYTPIITYLNKTWIGAVTSCISMKKELLQKILPVPYEQDWITRSDDCLVWGASLKLGYKCFLNEPLVNYRIHGNNYHYDKKLSKEQLYLRSVAINKLFTFFTKEFVPYQFEKLLSHEFDSLPEKTSDDLGNYLKALLKTNVNTAVKISQAISIIKNYLRNK